MVSVENYDTLRRSGIGIGPCSISTILPGRNIVANRAFEVPPGFDVLARIPAHSRNFPGLGHEADKWH